MCIKCWYAYLIVHIGWFIVWKVILQHLPFIRELMGLDRAQQKNDEQARQLKRQQHRRQLVTALRRRSAAVQQRPPKD